MNQRLSFSSRPRLTVSVGVSGHRILPDDSVNRLRETVACVLSRIRALTDVVVDPSPRSLFAEEPPQFRLVSPLAAGADCLVAGQALELGYELQVPLPMARAEYEKDFQNPARLREFNDLLSKASSVFEIEAANPERDHAYADASRVMLNHSDLLIALWDGEKTGFIAGTAATVRIANSSHIPTIHVNSREPGTICLIKDGFVSDDWEEGVKIHLQAILLPEKQEESGPMKKASHFAETYFRQKGVPDGNRADLEKRLSKIVETMPPKFRWPKPKPPSLDPVVEPPVNDEWRSAYDRFDKLSGHYSSRYRSCLVLRFVAPVAAIAFLVLGLYGDGWLQLYETSQGMAGGFFKGWIAVFFLMQIVMLLSTIVMELLDKRVMWHKKFFSYRVMAELLRQTEFLWPVGFCDVRYRHRTYSGDSRKWTTWYYRALAREAGLPSAVMTAELVSRWMRWVQDGFVIDQMKYHAKRYHREGNISSKLFRVGILLFVLGIFISAVRGYFASRVGFGGLSLSVPAALALVLPSLAVFCTGFCGYVGYPSNRQVSQEAEGCLDSIRQDIDIALSAPWAAGAYRLPGKLCYTNAREVAERIHACCTEELMDWEALISSRSIKCN